MNLLETFRSKKTTELPLIYVRESVVFPQTIAPVLALTKFCIAAADVAAKSEKTVVISLLKNVQNESVGNIDIYDIGTIAHIIQAVKLADGSTRLLVEGIERCRIKKTNYKKEYLSVSIETVDDLTELDKIDPKELDALVLLLKKDFTTYAELVRKIPNETILNVQKMDNPMRLCDLIGNAMGMKSERKQQLLSVIPVLERLEATEQALSTDMEILGMQKRISQKVRAKMDKTQKEYFLQEQLREINKELGKNGDEDENVELQKKMEAKNPPKEILEKFKKEINKLSKLQALSPEAGVIRSYCEWLSDLPWTAKTCDGNDLEKAKKILDDDHYGIKKVKERIIEFIAVRQLNEGLKGPIICLVGPPGTGKTSLGRSIAKTLDRDFVRMSLGGVRDEAEIRGHRKTYVGALPGKIIQCLKKAGSSNPVFLLDEIDKMSSDFRGDPASALLEVLDPEQNSTFVDHYLEVPYDLSKVVFVTTANSLHSIPYALLDRMEVIEVPGYSEYEKLEIAKRFIVPRQIEENGLKNASVKISDSALLEIIRHYTMEAGVRSLEREIARLVRRIAENAVENGFSCVQDKKPIKDFKKVINNTGIIKILGKHKRESDLLLSESIPGLACGMAWTELGGTVLPVEASVFEGEGDLILTGNLGDVMKESARAALTYLRANAHKINLSAKDFKNKVIHVHVPEGAIPKDGPSAGITLAVAMASALLGKALDPGWAMTGEITLTGRVLAIGGVKEKVLAAHRNSIKKIIIPLTNKKDLDDIPLEVDKELEYHFVSSIIEAFSLLLPEIENKKNVANK